MGGLLGAVVSPGVAVVSPGVVVVSPGAAVMVVWSVVEQAVVASISVASSMAAKLWWWCGMGVVLDSFDADGAVVMGRVAWEWGWQLGWQLGWLRFGWRWRCRRR